MAKESALVSRKSPITGFNFLLTFTNGLLNNNDSTLAQLAAYLNNNCDTEVSPQAIDQRINEAGKDFLKICFKKALEFSLKHIKINNLILKKFKHIYIIDSTNIKLHPKLHEIFKGTGGGASKSSLRIQFMYDFLTGKMYIEIGDVKLSDAKTLYNIIKENKIDTDGTALFLADLGYYKIDSFILINEASHNFISKLKCGVNVHNKTGKNINIPKLFKNRSEVNITVKIGNLECRLLGKKLPENIANKRLRDAKKDAVNRGRTLSKEKKIRLNYALYISNINDSLTVENVFNIYRLRWQIELIFKTWKSILGIHKIRSARVNRVLCEIYGKLIIAALTSNLYYALKYEYNIIVSYHKMLQYIKAVTVNWTVCILKGKDCHRKFLEKLIKQIIRLCRKNKQKNKPYIEMILEAMNINKKQTIRP